MDKTGIWGVLLVRRVSFWREGGSSVKLMRSKSVLKGSLGGVAEQDNSVTVVSTNVTDPLKTLVSPHNRLLCIGAFLNPWLDNQKDEVGFDGLALRTA